MKAGIRVPMIARLASVKLNPIRNRTCFGPFGIVFPNIRENLIGADLPKDLDGISFLPTLVG